MSSSSLSSATNNTSTSSSAAKAKKHLDHNAAAAAVAPGSSHHIDNSQSSSRSSSPSSGHPACAACKYQRRKCTPECLLAPHFPANLQRQFLNAHRLFGVKNILRIIKELDPLERTNAMHSIIYESNMRASDPVGGCLRVIQELERQLQRESMELALVLQQLSICRAQSGEGAGQTSGGAAAIVASDLEATNPCNLMLDVNETYGGDSNYMTMGDQQLIMQQQYCDYFYNDPGCENNNNINVVNGSNSNSSINNNNNCENNTDQGEVEMQVQALSVLTLQQQQQQEQEQEQEHRSLDMEEEEEVKPPVDLFETKPSIEDEQDSNNNDVNTTSESFPACRLGLGFSCY